MYYDKLIYKVVIWALFGISLWKEQESHKDLFLGHYCF